MLTTTQINTLITDNLPDNATELITAEKLREVFVALNDSDANPNDPDTEQFTTAQFNFIAQSLIAITLLEGQYVYGELYRDSSSNQNLPNAGAVIPFDGQGISEGFVYVGDSIEIGVGVSPANFNVQFEGTVDMKKDVEFTLHLRVNGVNVREIGKLSTDKDNQMVGFSLGAFLSLSDADVVEVFAIPDANNKMFDLSIGSRFTINRI